MSNATNFFRTQLKPMTTNVELPEKKKQEEPQASAPQQSTEAPPTPKEPRTATLYKKPPRTATLHKRAVQGNTPTLSTPSATIDPVVAPNPATGYHRVAGTGIGNYPSMFNPDYPSVAGEALRFSSLLQPKDRNAELAHLISHPPKDYKPPTKANGGSNSESSPYDYSDEHSYTRLDDDTLSLGDLERFANTYPGKLYGSLVQNLTSGVASSAGGLAAFVGLEDAGKTLNDVAEKVVTIKPEKEYSGKDFFSMDYVKDPGGLTANIGNLAGTMLSMYVPGGGVAGAASKIPGLAKLGAGVTKLAAKPGAIGSIARLSTSQLGKAGLGSAPIEAMMEGGDTMLQAKEMGMDDYRSRGYKTAAMNLPLLMGSNLIEGNLLGGTLFNAAGKTGEKFITRAVKAPFRAAPSLGANMLQNAGEEFYQQGISNLNTDQEYSFNPFKAPQDQIDAAIMGGIGGGVMAGVPSTARALLTTVPRKPKTRQFDLPIQSGMEHQVEGLKEDFRNALPTIGGILDEMGVAKGAAISSGYRTPEHNREVGGAENSYHTHGDAVDIVLPDNISKEKAEEVLARFKASGAFKEVLFHDAGSGYHLHLGGYNGKLSPAAIQHEDVSEDGENTDEVANELGTEEVNADTTNNLSTNEQSTVGMNEGQVDLVKEEPQDNKEVTDKQPTEANQEVKQDKAPAHNPTRPTISERDLNREVQAIKMYVAHRIRNTKDSNEENELRALFKNYGRATNAIENEFIDQDKAIDHIVEKYGATEDFQKFMDYQLKKRNPEVPSMVAKVEPTSPFADDKQGNRAVNVSDNAGNNMAPGNNGSVPKMQETKEKAEPLPPITNLGNNSPATIVNTHQPAPAYGGVNNVPVQSKVEKAKPILQDLANMEERLGKKGISTNKEGFNKYLQEEGKYSRSLAKFTVSALNKKDKYNNPELTVGQVAELAAEQPYEGRTTVEGYTLVKAGGKVYVLGTNGGAYYDYLKKQDKTDKGYSPLGTFDGAEEAKQNLLDRLNGEEASKVEALIRANNLDDNENLRQFLRKVRYDHSYNMSFWGANAPKLAANNLAKEWYSTPGGKAAKAQGKNYTLQNAVEEVAGNKKLRLGAFTDNQMRNTALDYLNFLLKEKKDTTTKSQEVKSATLAKYLDTITSKTTADKALEVLQKPTNDGTAKYEKIEKAARNPYIKLVEKNGKYFLEQDGKLNNISADERNYFVYIRQSENINYKELTNADKFPLANGFKTESGKSLYEAGEDEFVLLPNGSKDWGAITDRVSKEAKAQSNKDIPAGKIRVKVGNMKAGLIHAKERHEGQFKKLGYANTEEAILDVLQNYNKIYVEDDRGASPNYTLVMEHNTANKKAILTPLAFKLTKGEDGNYYVVITIFPRSAEGLFAEKKEVPAYDLQRIGEVYSSDVSNSLDVGETKISESQHPRTASSVMQPTSFSKNGSIDSLEDTRVPQVPSKVNITEKNSSVKEKDSSENSGGKLQNIHMGRKDEVITDDNEHIEISYALVPVKDIISSNNEDFSPNENYPEELQPRNRERAAMKQQVISMANNLEPRRVVEGATINSGAPIVNEDGVVLNGNGRVMAIRRAFGNSGGTKYRNYLKEHLGEYGISQQDFENTPNGLLVRMVNKPSKATVDKIINSTNGGERIGSQEQAEKDAKKLTADTLSRYEYNESGNISTANNSEFLTSAMKDIMEAGEQNAMFNADGTINMDGIQRIKRAVFTLAYNNEKLIREMTEEGSESMKNLTLPYLRLSPIVANLRLQVKEGKLYQDYKLADVMAQALAKYKIIKEDPNRSVYEYLNTNSLFAKDEDPAEVKAMVKFLDEHRIKTKGVDTAVQRMVEAIKNEGHPGQMSLMDNDRPTLLEIMNKAFDYVDGKNQGNLFSESATTKENTNKDTSVFGDVNEAKRAFAEAMGLEIKEKKEEPKEVINKKFVNFIEDKPGVVDEILAEIKELTTGRLNSGFDPTVMVSVIKLGGLFLQRGINGYANWHSKMSNTLKNKMAEQWLPSVWQFLKVYPEDRPYDSKKAAMAMNYVGALYEQGLTKYDDIYQEIEKDFGAEGVKLIAPYLESAYNGVKEYYEPSLNKGENTNDDIQSTEQEGTGTVQGISGGIQTKRVQSVGRKGNGNEERNPSNGVLQRQTDGIGQADNGRDGSSGEYSGGNPEQKPGTTGSAGDGEPGSLRGRGTGQRGTIHAGEQHVGTGIRRGRQRDTLRSETVEEIIPDEQRTSAKDKTPEELIATGKEVKTVPTNYQIKADEVISTKEKRIEANIAAIKLLKEIEEQGRMATPLEQETLAKYTGWGGISQAAFSIDTAVGKELAEILSDEEIKGISSSTLSAYYTSPTIVMKMWEMAEQLGFKGGRVLEPSMGVGNFYGLMPRELMAKSKLTGYELDTVTGGIAKQLYQEADINVKGFEKITAPDNYYDLVVGNVPFGSFSVHDPEFNKYKFNIHNYFFAKAMAKVRPGGLVMLITSTNTMDGTAGETVKLRELMSQQADLVAAIRLPDTAFTHTGTKVNSDIIILRKKGEGIYKGEQWVNTEYVNNSYSQINEYYNKHPENIIGERTVEMGQYGRKTVVYKGKGINLDNRLKKILGKLPAKIIKQKVTRTKANTAKPMEILTEGLNGTNGIKDNAYYISPNTGKLLQRQGNEAVPVTVKGKNAEALLRDYIRLRDTVKRLLLQQLDPKVSEKTLADTRAMLNKQYDAFVQKYGYLNDNKVLKVYKEDPDAGTVAAIEDYKEDKLTKKITVKKNDIFTKRTVGAIEEVTTAENPMDGMFISLATKGHIDIDYIANLTGIPANEVINSLKGVIFKNPDTNMYEHRDEYLSGNVKRKLAVAMEMAKGDKSYQANVQALMEVQPLDLVAEEIDVNLGTTWIPTEDYEAFVKEYLPVSTSNFIKYIPANGSWIIDDSAKRYTYSAANNSEFAVYNKADFWEVLNQVLNNGNKKITKTVGRKTEVDNEATAALEEAKEKMQRAFKDWIFRDEDRRNRLVKYYNDNFNTTVLRKYDGSHLTLPGINITLPKLNKHQRDAIWRIMQGQNTLLAHCVGAGKTWTMQAAAMEMRRLGTARKPMFVIPNHMLLQFQKEWLQLYPNAKLLVLQSEDLPDVPKKDKDGNVKRNPANAAKRLRTLSRIQTGDWDGVIISNNMFSRLPLSGESYSEFIQEELDLYRQAVTQAKEGNMDGRTRRNLEMGLKKLEAKLQAALAEDKKDLGIAFEELGVDALFVDEADLFKNLGYVTRLGTISGLANSNSQRSVDMYNKVRYLTKTQGGNVVFATGTPVSNSIAEMYTMLKYMDTEMMRANDWLLFDNWANHFCQIEKAAERNPDTNGYRVVSKVVKFVNYPELGKAFKTYADVKRPEDLNLPRPALKGGKPNVVVVEAPDVLMDFIKTEVAERTAAIKSKKVDPSDDNMLKLTSELRKASLDMRLLDPSLSEQVAGGKILAAADNIFNEYKASDKSKGLRWCSVTYLLLRVLLIRLRIIKPIQGILKSIQGHLMFMKN